MEDLLVRSLSDICNLSSTNQVGLQQAMPIITNSSDYDGPKLAPICFMNGGKRPCVGREVLERNMKLALANGASFLETFPSDVLSGNADLWLALREGLIVNANHSDPHWRPGRC